MGQKLFYRKLGQGRPLVVVHGLFGSSDNWLSIAKMLEETHTLYLVDLRNHGQSVHSSTFDYSTMADDLHDFLVAHDLKGCDLMGHSMGGKAAMLFAALNPGYLRKLIVVDIGPKQYPLHHNEILAGLNAIPIEAIQSRGEADKVLSEYVQEVGIRQFLLKNLSRSSEGFSWKINLKVLTEKIEEIVKSLPENLIYEGSTLFVRGSKSNYILDEDIYEIENQFPNASTKDVANAGHWIHAEQPGIFVEIIKKYLDE